MKKLMVTVVVVGVFLFSGIAYADLIAYWSFDGGDTRDDSGNGHHGTAHNGITYENGILGQAASFDGIDDYITIAHDSVFNGDTGISISLWLFIDEMGLPITDYTKRIIDKRGRSGTMPGWNMNLADKVGWHGYIGGGTNAYAQTYDIGVDSWYHVVATYDNDTAKFYLDGDLVDSNEFVEPS